jgi:hypothetical protein
LHRIVFEGVRQRAVATGLWYQRGVRRAEIVSGIVVSFMLVACGYQEAGNQNPTTVSGIAPTTSTRSTLTMSPWPAVTSPASLPIAPSSTEPPPRTDVWFTDFSEHPVGSVPQDWTSRWAPSIAVIVEESGRHLLQWVTVNDARSALAWEGGAPPDAADVEALSLWRHGEDDKTDARLVLRGAGSEQMETGYVFGVSEIGYTGVMKAGVVRFRNGAYSNSRLGTVADFPDPGNDWTWTRARIKGNRQYLKVWAYREPEPRVWTALGFNAALDEPGFTGLFSGDNRSSLFAWFGVAVDGQSVPTPTDVVVP